MNKEKLEELLDSIYELEGLVHLAIAREDAPDVLPDLIARKARELSSRAIAVSQTPTEETFPEETEVEDFKPEETEVEEIEVEIPEPEETEVAETFTEEPVKEKPARADGAGGRLVFSVNDRYRFRRELFDNSDADFNTTLALVASMESYEEAEDYFTMEREWDPAVPAVSDFLEVIRKYFG